MEHENDHPDFIQDSISIQENLLESLHARLLGLDKDIEFHHQKIQKHEESIHIIQQQESSLKRKRDISSTQVKNLQVTLDKTITTLKKKLKAYNERFAQQLTDEPHHPKSVAREENMVTDAGMNVHEEKSSSEGDETVDKAEPVSDSVILRKQTTLPFYLGYWYNQKENLDDQDNMKSDKHLISQDRSSSSALQHMISIAQREVVERRRHLKNEEEIFMDYFSSLQNTTLDWRMLAKYDPFYLFQEPNMDIDTQIKEKVSSLQKSCIDPHQIICRKALFGKCDDESCTYQHFSGRANVKSKLYRLRTVPIKRKRVYLDHKNFPIPNSIIRKEERLQEDGYEHCGGAHERNDKDYENLPVTSPTNDEDGNESLIQHESSSSENFANSFEDNDDFIALPEEEALDPERCSNFNPFFEVMRESISDIHREERPMDDTNQSRESLTDHSVSKQLKSIGILLNHKDGDDILALDYDSINDVSFWNLLSIFVLGIHIGMYSGRFDVVKGVMILWKKNECRHNNDDVLKLSRRIMCDIHGLINFVLNCQASIHPGIIFRAHLLLSNTVRFLIESLDSSYEEYINQYDTLSHQISCFVNSTNPKPHAHAQSLSFLEGEITALQQKMCDKNNLRFACILATAIGNELSVSISNILEGVSDPQTVIEKCLFPICSMIKHHSRIFSMICSVDNEAKNTELRIGPTAKIACFAIFGSAIFTSFSALLEIARRDSQLSRINPFSSRSKGSLFEAISLLMQCITHLDFSGSFEDTIDEHIFLSPFFSLYSILLTCQSDYDKAYKLLVSVLQPRSSLSTASALLWSQLIQICISFPNGDQSENEENMIPRALVDGCAHHEVYPFKVLFEGDCSLISALNNSEDDNHNTIVNFSMNCADLKCGSTDGCVSLVLANRQNIPPVSLIVPLSLMRIGMSLSSLSLVGCGLKKLPFTFGSYFSALSDLNLSNNQLKSLPESMQKMTSLKNIRLGDNLLSTIPAFFEFFSRLERFEASNNKITDISALMNCISLKVIIMKGNPAKAPLDLPIRLKHLSILDLDGNEDD